MECHSGTPFFVQVLRRSADDSHNTNECFIEFNCYKYNDLFLFYDGAVSIYCILYKKYRTDKLRLFHI